VDSVLSEPSEAFELPLLLGDVTRVPRFQLEVRVEVACGFIPDTASRIGDFPACAAIDLEKVGESPLWVRTIRDGDRMRPLGLNGSRKLQDILVDEKVPRALRRELLVVVCDGEIVWLPGYRISENWKVRCREGRALHLSMIRVEASQAGAE
jgi:tRNA(Ile)-lysidine synthetase-like protein